MSWDCETDPEYQAELKGTTPTPDLFPTRHIPKLKAEARLAGVLASVGRM